MNERGYSYIISRLKNDLFLEISVVIVSFYLIFRLLNGFKKNKIFSCKNLDLGKRLTTFAPRLRVKG